MKRKNIFKGAKFGDKFVTRDGRVAILIEVGLCNVSVAIKDENEISFIDKETGCAGTNPTKEYPKDIVSRYILPEDKLDELATEKAYKYTDPIEGIDDGIRSIMCAYYYHGFMDGYKYKMR